MAEEVVAGRYVILEELGRGASATVFRARDTTLQREVALKVISASLAADPEFTWRFQQEALLSAKLDHPHIVTVHDVGTLPDGRGFIAMRLLGGLTLDQLMAQRGPLPPGEVAGLVAQVAAALDYTHHAGLVHRDVKPSNVKVDASGWATLTDFGIARALDSARVTLPGLTIGTPRYMAPEQVRGEAAAPAADIYALAVMAFEMLAGRAPFEGDGTALMYKIVHEPPPELADLNPAIAPAVADVIRKGLEKAPEARWESAGAFARALEAVLQPAPRTVSAEAPTAVSPLLDAEATLVSPAAGPATGATAIPSAGQGAPPPGGPGAKTDTAQGSGGSRRKVLLGLGGAAAVLVLGAIAAFALRGGGDDEARSGRDSDGGGSGSGLLGARRTPEKVPTRASRPTNTPPTTSLESLGATATPLPPTATAAAPTATATNLPATTGPTRPPPPPPPPTATATLAPAGLALIDWVLCHSAQFCPFGDEALSTGYDIFVVFQLSPPTTAFVEMDVFFDGAPEYTSPFSASSSGVYYDTIPYAERPGLLALDIYADGEYVDTIFADVN